jgi:hypothetical protein
MPLGRLVISLKTKPLERGAQQKSRAAMAERLDAVKAAPGAAGCII